MPSRSVRPPRGESDRIDGSGQAGSGRPPDGPERGSTSSPSGDTLHVTDRDHLHPTDFSDRARRARMQARSFARDFGARLVVMHVVEATHVAEELGDAVTRSPDSPYLGANTVENAVSSCCVRSSDLHPRQGEREKKFPSAHALVRESGRPETAPPGRKGRPTPALAHQGVGARRNFPSRDGLRLLQRE